MMSSSFGGEIGIQPHRSDGRAVQNGVEDQRRAVAAEGQRAGGHFVEHGPEGKQVGARVKFFAAHLLRRHVGDRAQRAPGLVRCSAVSTVAVAMVSARLSHLSGDGLWPGRNRESWRGRAW